MIIGIPREIKDHEGRVALSPEKVGLLVRAGHEVLIERFAGSLSGFGDEKYIRSGAKITDVEKVWDRSELILKVKEPLQTEYRFLRKGLTVFSFFHFAGNPDLRKACETSHVRAIPYESIVALDGSRPILKAMSRITGEVAVDIGAQYLRKENKGRGILLRDATVTIIGAAGSVGSRAFELLIRRVKNLIALDSIYNRDSVNAFLSFLRSNPANIEESLRQSDLVICAAVSKIAGAPKLITRQMVKQMPHFSVLIDVPIDEGGVSETSRPTTHTDPVYINEGVIHYCVPNIPGTVPSSSTIALSEASFPYVMGLANGSDVK